MIAKMMDDNNHITIPGFYDDVEALTEDERIELAQAPFDVEEFKKSIALSDIHGEKGYSSMERVSIRPTLETL